MKMQYDSDYVIKKAENRWPEILDSLGIPSFYEKSKCVLCESDKTFKIDDISKFIFYCSNCKVRGGGTLLLQHYHQWDMHEAIERIARQLQIREKVCIYG